MAKNLGNMLGGWAFLIGVILAVVLGVFPAVNSTSMILLLVVIGLIVGLLNVADKEVTPFLFSGLVLVLIGDAGSRLLVSIPAASGILSALMTIFIPATVIVAVKNVLSIAKK